MFCMTDLRFIQQLREICVLCLKGFVFVKTVEWMGEKGGCEGGKMGRREARRWRWEEGGGWRVEAGEGGDGGGVEGVGVLRGGGVEATGGVEGRS